MTEPTPTLPGDPARVPVAPQLIPPQGPAVPQHSSAPRVTTIVWGAIVLLVGCLIVASAFGRVLDFQLIIISILALAGVALIGSAVAHSIRHRTT